MSEPQAYLNGRWLPASQAAVPVFDAGFVLGATVAEQLRTFGGRLFRLGDHLQRLARSLEIVGVEPGAPCAELAAAAEQLVAGNHRLLPAGDDLGLTVFVTPGPYASLAPAGCEGRPTIGMHTYPLPFHLWAEKYERGESLMVSAVEQVSPRSWPAELKCRSRMHYFLAEGEARRRQPGARALLLDQRGCVTETLTSNVLAWFRDEGLVSPPRDHILRGISLATVIELAAQLDVPFVERDLRPAELATADEVFLASTPNCLLPVTHLDGRPIGGGRPGVMFAKLLSAWSARVGIEIAEQARRYARQGAGLPR